MTGPHEIDNAAAVDELRSFLADLDPPSRQRGWTYYRNGAVLNIGPADSKTVTAVVRGSRDYSVELERLKGGWQSFCTCARGGNCRHAGAVALKWVEWLADPRTRLPPIPAGERPSKPPRETFRSRMEPVLAAKLGRALLAEEGAFLGKLSMLYHNFLQSGAVTYYDTDRLGIPEVSPRTGVLRPF